MPAITSARVARCARGEHCGDAAPSASGVIVGAWAEPGSPFCKRCTSAVGRTLGAMPLRYAWLRVHIGDKQAGRGEKVSGSRDAPLPLRVDIDALIRDMVFVLCSWEDQVADAAGLDRPATALSRRRRDEVAIPGAVATLTGHLPLLLGLPPQPMTRRIHVTRHTPPPPPGTTGVVHKLAGWAEINVELGGADAGLEIFRLAWLSRRLLGETIPPPVPLDGVPCKGCDQLALEVCAEPVYRSECAACGDLLTQAEYDDWVRLYAAWARRQVAVGGLLPNDLPAYCKTAA